MSELGTVSVAKLKFALKMAVEKEAEIQTSYANLGVGMTLAVIFLLFSSYSYLKRPIGLPCDSIKRIGVLKKTRNAMFVVNGNQEFIVAWPARRGDDGGAGRELKDAKNGMRIESNVCANTLVRVVLEGKEVYAVTSGDARKKNVADAKFGLLLALVGLIPMMLGRYKLRKFRR
ncbi:hypothetical protein [Herbaspirillum sp. 1130]|uniref:hypothetical protein n=1 Tax=Herbaspirillum sp. 1130 TaxID=2806562 RepID=UPI001AEAC281|nr:hypothetical protein [Herbaspirillum sp. 1130]MBP1314192.1 hypothetical protein [Herbaspirillum sp. 1130]